MESHFSDENARGDVSCAAGYSKYHANRNIKGLTGNTPFESSVLCG